MVDFQEVDHVALDLLTQSQLFALAWAPISHGLQGIGSHAVVPPELDVVEHRHAPKQSHVLKCACQTHGSAHIGFGVRNVLPLQHHATLLGFVKTRDGVEQTGFARPIGPNDGGDFTRLGLQRYTREGFDAPKAQVHIFNR